MRRICRPITLAWQDGGLRLSLLHGGVEEHVDAPTAANECHLVVGGSRRTGDGAELVVDAVSRGVAGAGSGATGRSIWMGSAYRSWSHLWSTSAHVESWLATECRWNQPPPSDP